MRHWERTKLALLCGGCGKTLPKESPIQVIELAAVKRKKFRGECCADMAAPDDLPDAPSSSVELAARVESIRAIGRRVTAEWSPYKEPV